MLKGLLYASKDPSKNTPHLIKFTIPNTVIAPISVEKAKELEQEIKELKVV